MAGTLSTSTGIKISTQSGGFSDTAPSLSGSEKDMPFLDESISGSYDELEARHSQNRFPHEVPDGNLGRFNVDGDITTFVDNDQIGYFLHAFFGQVSKTADTPTTGFDEHSFTPSDTGSVFQVKTQIGTASDGKHAWNCLFDSMSFEATDELAQMTFSLAAANLDASTGSSESFTFPTGDWFHFKHATAEIDDNQSGSYSAASINSATIDFENNVITDDFVLGQDTLDSILFGEFSVTGSLELRYETGSGFEGWFEGDNVGDMKLTYSRATNQDLIIELKNCYVTDNEVAQSSGELITRSVDFMAEYSSSTTPSICEVKLVNDAGADYTAY